MRLDEMILKANLLHENKGKVYFNAKDGVTYSLEKGFSGGDIKSLWNDGWEEKPKRHLTVSEAEKELDCEIDTPDISKLFISSDILPEDGLKIILLEKSCRSCCSGFYDAKNNVWRTEHSGAIVIKPEFYIKWANLIKLLPKE